MKRLLNCAFVAVALLIAATAALRSHSSATSFSTTPAVHAPNPARQGAMAPMPTPQIKKAVRYEAIIENWKRYHSAAKSSG